MSKRIFVFAGPNGAGKTTAALTIFPSLINIYEFLNADEIAKGLAPLHPESVGLTASKLMINRLRELLDLDKNFAFETTGAGTNFVKYLEKAKEKKYEIHLLYLWLDDVELAIDRVAKRVAQGGHNIPEDVIRRRYISGLRNVINIYLPLSSNAVIIDNSNIGSHVVIDRK
jgi:predicted ABC-type ATPase